MPLRGPTKDPRYELAKPETASVFDSDLEKAVRWVVGMFGGGDTTSEALNVLNPMAGPLIGLVPRQTAEQLMERLAPTVGRATSETTANVRAAVEHLVKRFPRLMSHVTDLRPEALTPREELAKRAQGEFQRVTKGRFSPWGAAVSPSDFAPDGSPFGGMSGRVGSIQYDPAFVVNDADAVQTLSHELTHAAQALRQTDRARRNPLNELTFEQKYAANREKHGYYAQPEEVGARRSSGKETNRYLGGRVNEGTGRFKAMVNMAGRWGAEAPARIRRMFPDAPENEIQAAMQKAGSQ